MPQEDPITAASGAAEDARRFARRIQSEVEADAERRRREDPLLAREEREIERIWAQIAPPGAVGSREELLLDRVERLSMIDVDAPLGERPGVRQVKGAIRKGTYWYLRYMSDQLNALHNVQSRLLRRLDERVLRLEGAAGLGSMLDDLLGPPSAPGAAVGTRAAGVLADQTGPVLVASSGSGDAVAALTAAGVRAYGVDGDAEVVVRGVDAGLDLRVADPRVELQATEAGSLGGLVLGGFASRLMVAEIVEALDEAARVLGPEGVLVVAVDDPAARTGPHAELVAGLGVSPAAWALLAARHAVDVVEIEVDGGEVTRLVVARMS